MKATQSDLAIPFTATTWRWITPLISGAALGTVALAIPLYREIGLIRKRMGEALDPYRAWLGIPPQEQPPNHYRLLGVGVFEGDGAAIGRAAQEQAARVRRFQTGPHAQICQQLLLEIAKAKACLLDPQARAAYDASLRTPAVSPVAPNPPDAVPPRVVGPEALKEKGFKWEWLRQLEESTYPGYDKTWRRTRSNYLGMLRLIDDQVDWSRDVATSDGVHLDAAATILGVVGVADHLLELCEGEGHYLLRLRCGAG